MRVAQAKQWTAQDVAESYALWWREAGLHSATSEEAHGWLAEPAAEARPADSALPSARVAEAVKVTPLRPAVGRAMPGDLAAFRAWLVQDSGQPEARWNGALFLPSKAVNARLIVLCDMPDDGADDGVLPFAPPTARFLTAMLGAIGLNPENIAFAPLAMRRPPGGMLDEATTATLAARMEHYLGLAAPRAALILGDRTTRALLAVQSAPGPAGLPEINHAGGTMPVAALASPELLMRRPLAKAASWQTLRLLTGVIG